MTSFVADSSLAIAWFVPSQATHETEALSESVASGVAFVVPVIWTLEVANVLLVLRRRQRLTTDQYQTARQNIAVLRPVVDDEGIQNALDSVLDLAESRKLSVYDATYLELAIRRGLPIASRDHALNRAAAASGVKPLLAAR